MGRATPAAAGMGELHATGRFSLFAGHALSSLVSDQPREIALAVLEGATLTLECGPIHEVAPHKYERRALSEVGATRLWWLVMT